MLSFEFCETCKKAFLAEHRQTTDSDYAVLIVECAKSRGSRGSRGLFLWVKLVSHSRGSNSWVILVGHSGGSFSWVKLVGHFRRSFWWVILVGQTRGSNMWVILVAHSWPLVIPVPRAPCYTEIPKLPNNFG